MRVVNLAGDLGAGKIWAKCANCVNRANRRLMRVNLVWI